ncbi:MAG: hypothetical protein GX335_08935 [Firmicutes bacterium]|nr:hypothetical protein [Bacillota bacterium]
MRNRIICFTLLLMLIFSLRVLALGVQPMVLNIEGSPGGLYQFSLTIYPENSLRTVNLGLYQPTQDLDGSVAFLQAEPDIYPPLGWVHLEKNRIAVPPGEPTEIFGTIKVPFDAGGSYTVILMVEPEIEDAEKGVRIIVRYAVRITVNVDRPGLRSDLQVVDMDLVPDKDGKPLLTVRIKNPSSFRFPISAESTIRDENRRLVERAQLKTPSAWESGHDSFAIYPYTELLLTAPLKEPLYGGKFYLQNFISYDTSKQLIRGQEIIIEENQFTNLWTHFLVVGPETMETSIQPGAAATHILQLENRFDQDFLVKIGAEEIIPDYKQSVFEHLDLEIRGGAELALRARQRARSVLLIRTSRGLEPGGYYGLINIHVFSSDGEHLETHTIPLSVLLGKDWNRAVEVKSLAVEAEGEEYLFSTAVFNSGNVHLAPRATLEIRDENNELMNTFHLGMPEGQERILPEMNGFLTATVAERNVIPGEYLAAVLVFEGSEQIGLGEFPLIIEE